MDDINDKDLFQRNNSQYIDNDLDSIIQACLLEDKKAQRALIKLFFGFAKSICLRYAANREEAEEILNDGFLKVFNNLSKFDHTKPFKAWLRSIMVNTAIDYFRRGQKYTHHVDIDDIEIVSQDIDVISKISSDEMLMLIQRLSPAYRMVFTLYVVDGYNHREIAEMLGIKEGTSKSNLQDARKKLQVMIKNMYPQVYLAYASKNTRINEN